MRKRTRLAAILLTAVVFVVMVASLFVVAHETNHDCAGEGCGICAILTICRRALKALSDALAILAVIAALVSCAVFLTTARTATFHAETPISLKVKLLN